MRSGPMTRRASDSARAGRSPDLGLLHCIECRRGRACRAKRAAPQKRSRISVRDQHHQPAQLTRPDPQLALDPQAAPASRSAAQLPRAGSSAPSSAMVGDGGQEPGVQGIGDRRGHVGGEDVSHLHQDRLHHLGWLLAVAPPPASGAPRRRTWSDGRGSRPRRRCSRRTRRSRPSSRAPPTSCGSASSPLAASRVPAGRLRWHRPAAGRS